MTFWALAEHAADPPLPRADELGASLRELHAALAAFPGELGPLADVRDWLDRLLTGLRPSPARSAQDIEALRARLHALTPTVFASPLPAQAIHGDASLGNLLRTGDRLLWNDLEDVCAGPVHWDLAGLVTDARARGCDEAFVTELLRAYGGPALGELDDFVAAHLVYTTIWRAFSDQGRAWPWDR